MGNESMANSITDVPSAIAELLAVNKQLKQQLQQKEEQLKVACELMKTQKDCIDHLLGKKESFGDATTSGFGLRVDVFLQKQESLKTTKEGKDE